MMTNLRTSARIAAVIMIALLSLEAQSIGRSGNGRIASLADGFTTDFPKYFEQSQQLDKEALRISAPSIRTSVSPLAPAIELRRFAIEFPQESTYSRPDVRNSFIAHGWWQASHVNPCIEVFLSDNESASSAVATWGEGRGVVMIGPKNGISKSAIQEMLERLEVEPGACGWK